MAKRQKLEAESLHYSRNTARWTSVCQRRSKYWDWPRMEK